MGLSFPHLLILGLIAILLFGRGRISSVMEELGSGIKGFKKGITDVETPTPPSQIEQAPTIVTPEPTKTNEAQ